MQNKNNVFKIFKAETFRNYITSSLPENFGVTNFMK